MSSPKTNSLKAWFLAARPKTLTGALAPVLIALSLAWSDIHTSNQQESTFLWIPATLCALFAILMQIDANFINDYFDCRDGIDKDDRLGPERACQQGWVTLAAMKRAIIITTALSAIVGLPTIIWGGWVLVAVGLACILFSFLYTTLLSRIGLGDVLVLIFFGIVPVCTTYYIQTGSVTWQCFVLSIAMGLVTDLLLLVNNYRDRDTDLKHGKHTLVTYIGAEATEWLYLLLGIVGYLVSMAIILDIKSTALCQLLLLYIFFHGRNWRIMVNINHGKQLNMVLGRTALGIFLYAILTSILIIVSTYIPK